MESSCFGVEAQILVNSEHTRKFLVAISLLSLDSQVNEVMALEHEPQQQRGQKCLPLEAKRIILDEYHVCGRTDIQRQTISAHAVAMCKHQMSHNTGSLAHTMDDQFFIVPSKDNALAKKNPKIEVYSLKTAESGFIDEVCLSFFPHYKVAVGFKFDTIDNEKVENQVGEFFTIGQQPWTMNWAPEGTSRSTAHLYTFGRNMTTQYSGIVPMDKLVELQEWELEGWGLLNAFPAIPNRYQSQHQAVRVSCEHGEGCFADRGPDPMEGFRPFIYAQSQLAANLRSTTTGPPTDPITDPGS